MKECNQCGKCCIKYADGGLSATAAEISRWETARPAIARFVHGGEIWCDPATGQKLTRCPFLQEELAPQQGQQQGSERRLYSCGIYQDRPDDCRHYPVNITEMVIDECEMLEPVDLADTQRAQRVLDKMMIASRPANN